MLGTIVNTLAILGGAFLGMMLKGGFPESWSRSLLKAIGLAVVLVGLKGALETDRLLLVIISIAAGALLGEALNIEGRLTSLGNWLEARVAFGSGDFSKGFVSASLIFCVGAMAVVGSFESGLNANHEILFAKSAMDGITGLILASTYGGGGAVFRLQCFHLSRAVDPGRLVPKAGAGAGGHGPDVRGGGAAHRRNRLQHAGGGKNTGGQFSSGHFHSHGLVSSGAVFFLKKARPERGKASAGNEKKPAGLFTIAGMQPGLPGCDMQSRNLCFWQKTSRPGACKDQGVQAPSACTDFSPLSPKTGQNLFRPPFA